MITGIQNVQIYNTPEEMFEYNESKNLNVYDLITLHKDCEAIWKFGEKKVSTNSKVGIAAHGAILSESNFKQKFMRGFDKDSHENVLTNDAAVKAWIKSEGRSGYSKLSGKELFAFADETGEHPPILKQEEERLEETARAMKMTLVPAKEYDAVLAMRDTLKQIPRAVELMENSTMGYGLTCEIFIEGFEQPIPVKIKIDMIGTEYVDGAPAESNEAGYYCGSPSGFPLIDYKTLADVSPEGLSAQFIRANEYMKQTFVCDVMHAVTVHNEAETEFKPGILAQRNEAPHIAKLRWLNNAQIDEGRHRYMDALRKYSESMLDGIWPEYDDFEADCESPKWHKYEPEEMSE